MKVIIIFLAGIFLFNINLLYPQRCGDFLLFRFTDNGKIIELNEYSSLKVLIKHYDVNDRSKIYSDEVKPETKELKEENRLPAIRTICGLIEARIVAEYNKTKMIIIIKDIPGDAGNIILKDLNIKNGIYEIDLQGRKLANCQLAHDTIISGNLIIEERLWRIDNNKIAPAH